MRDKNELLQPVLRQTLTFADSFADMIERLIHDAPERRGGILMRVQLPIGPARFERWIRSAELTTSTPKLLTNSMVPASTRETYGTAFMGSTAWRCDGSRQEASKKFPLLVPGHVGVRLAGEQIQHMRLNTMQQFLGRRFERESNNTSAWSHAWPDPAGIRDMPRGSLPRKS